MAPTQELIDAIYCDKLRAARREEPGRKLLDGPRLFDVVCQRMEAGIRHQHPAADDLQVQKILRDRINRLRQIEEHGIYHPVEESP